MEESKEEGVLVGSVSEPREVGGGESETLVESMDTEVQGEGQIEGSSTGEVLEEGELCDKCDVKAGSGCGGGSHSGHEAESNYSDEPGLRRVGDSGGPSEGLDQVADVTQEESVERDKKTTDGGGVVTDDKGSMREESIDDEAQDGGVGGRVDGTAEAVTSTEVGTQNLQAVEVVAREGDANEVVNAEVVEGDLQDNGVKDGEEARAAKEAANVKSDAKSSGILVEEGVDIMKMVDDEVFAVQDIKTLKAGNSDDGIQNSVIETKVSSSLTTEEDFSLQNQATGEEAAASSKLEEGKDGNSLDGAAKNSNGKLEREAVDSTGPGSLDEPKIVTSEGEFAVINNEELTCSKVEGMDIDALNENLYFTLEELTSHVETNGGSTENHCNLIADSIPLSQPVQVTSGLEIAVGDEKALSNSDKECLDQSMAHDLARVDSKLEPEKGFDRQVTQAKHLGFHEESETVVGQRESNAEAVNGDSGNKIAVNSSPNPNFEVSDYVDLDGVLSCSGKEQNLTAKIVSGGTVADAQAIDEATEIASQPMETEESVADCVPHVIQGGAVKGTKDHQEKIETVAGFSGNHVNLPADLTLSSQLNHENDKSKIATADDQGTFNPSVQADEALRSKPKVLGSGESDQPLTSSETVDESVAHDHLEANSNVGKEMKVVEQAVDVGESNNVNGGQELETEEQDPGQTEIMEDKKQAVVNHGSLVKMHRATYQLPPEEDMFSVSDLVWGKVRSHPWWPGQIFNTSDASEKAMKYHRKDCFLVGYFGDRTFAWNEASLLKPFRTQFSQAEKQGNSEAFQNAVSSALEEVSRRVELGLACSCMPKDVYEKIKYQIIENTGIAEELSKRGGVDKSTSAATFEPAKLIEYVKALAQFPLGGADRLELVIAKAQLLAFNRLKGFNLLPEFQYCGELLENNVDSLYEEDESMDMVAEYVTLYPHNEQICPGQEILAVQKGSYHKRKHNLKDSDYLGKKERSLSELMDGERDSPEDEFEPDGKSAYKRRALDSFAADSANQDGRKTISFAKVSLTTPSIPKPSFKIGERIRRVAPSILKCHSEKFQKVDGSSDRISGDGSDSSFQNVEDAEKTRMMVPGEYSSLDELLSQLHVVARDPLGGYEFLNVVASFFSDLRNSVVLEQFSFMEKGGRKKRMSHPLGGSPETFEFEDMSDTYWTDRIIQNGSEEPPSGKNRKREIDPIQGSRRSSSRRRYSDSDDLAARKPIGYVDENSPAELVMNFSEVNTVPSEMNLNKMFKHFGPLKESETEVDKEASRARVVFKRCSDAEAAFSSAGKFGIFGPVAVNYQLNYSVSAPFRTQLMATALGDEDTTLCLDY